MEQENSQKMEQIEKAQDDLKAELEVIKELLKKLDKGKNAQEFATQVGKHSQDDLLYPPGFEPNPGVQFQGGSSNTPVVNQAQQGMTAEIPLNATAPDQEKQGTKYQVYDNPTYNLKDSGLVPTWEEIREVEKMKGDEPESKNEDSSKDRISLLEDRLGAIDGMDFFGSVDAGELCLVPGVVVPPKFKPPKFEKYDGTKCPVAHVTMYYRKMAAHAQNEKLLMHVFQESLTGSAEDWYVRLDRSKVKTWNALARAFIRNYRHVMELAPDRLSLQNMEKKPTETFREYAQSWRDIAIRV